MKFTALPIHGAYRVDLEKREDSRGFFARMFCIDAFKDLGIDFSPVQMNNSLSLKKGTIRGLHYQEPPHDEAKYFRCIGGTAYSVIADLRPDSPTYKKWTGIEITAESRTSIFMPRGCAAGYQALDDNTEMIYTVDNRYSPRAEHGIRWDDPAFAIVWPIKDNVIVSEKDASAPDFH